MSTLAALSVWVVLAAAWATMRGGPGEQAPRRPGPGRVGIVLWLLVAVPSLLQLTVWPGLLVAGRREATAARDGEVWRLVTSLVLQEGGWAGAAFNLVILGVTLVLVGRWLRPWVGAALLVGGGVVANLVVVGTGGPPGAGCSMATIVLAVSAVGGVPRRRSRRVAMAVIALAGVVLLAVGDVHAPAVVLGLLAAAGLQAADWR